MDKTLTVYLVIGAVILFGLATYAYNSGFFAPAKTGNATKCVDSDKGADGYVKGTLTYNKMTYPDICLNDTTVKEYYCTTTDAVGTKYINCAKKCVDGACIR
jgi:hypothetical protein